MRKYVQLGLWTVVNFWEKCLGTKFRKYYSKHVLKRLAVWCKNSYAMEFDTYLLTYLITYLLTPCSRILLEKLTGSQLVKKSPTFYGTRMFITAFTSARHLFLSWGTTIQSMAPHPASWRSLRIRETVARYRIRSPDSEFEGLILPLQCSEVWCSRANPEYWSLDHCVKIGCISLCSVVGKQSNQHGIKTSVIYQQDEKML